MRCFAATACARGMSESKVSRICHVFERLQDMFEAVSKEHNKVRPSDASGGLDYASADPVLGLGFEVNPN